MSVMVLVSGTDPLHKLLVISIVLILCLSMSFIIRDSMRCRLLSTENL